MVLDMFIHGFLCIAYTFAAHFALEQCWLHWFARRYRIEGHIGTRCDGGELQQWTRRDVCYTPVKIQFTSQHTGVTHVKRLTNTYFRLDEGPGGGAYISGSISSARLHNHIHVSDSHSTHQQI